MNEIVRYKKINEIALITLNSPPVNGLNIAVRRKILSGFEQAINDNTVKAIIITSGCEIFCAGADINEFDDADKMFAKPSLPEICLILEESKKTIIAAINGTAFGGGLELAMACDYRMAAPKAKMALPEVNLGIIPGAGGTQRLPRLGGVRLALEMITSGKPIDATQALSTGLVDHIHEGEEDFITAAVNYANELIFQDVPLKSCAQIKVNTDEIPENYFADFRASIARRTRGFYAPERCIQAIEAACSLPLEEGLKKELELAIDCLDTSQARAQQHLFFAERASGKIPGIDPKTRLRQIEKVAIIGSGTMGGGIAMNYLNAGIETIILDLNSEALERGIGFIEKNYAISAKKGRMTPEQVTQRMALLQSTTNYDDLREVDLVVEAVFENMDIKKKVFQALDKICKPGAILATNTSTLDVNEIAHATSRPEDVIGLHFFSPANVMRLLEVVRGKKTADDVILTTLKMAKMIHKVPVVVGVCFGFVGNRMIEPYIRETFRLMLEGASPEQIDTAITDFGFAMGPCSMSDMAGIDVGYLVREAQRERISRDPSYQIIGDKLYELGRYGQKTSRGFYIYEDREKHNDPEIIKICENLAEELGIERREITDKEIIERCVYMLINEGAHILEEGIAYRSGDCDLIYTNGYGFPIWRGGPMQYADEIGPEKIVSAINHYHKSLGTYGEMWFSPAPLLQRLANEGKKLKDLRNIK
ncbi:MAG: enoyl-CoA hydratase/isomerase family protein [Emcibacter sp.]|nr:enoyl-CoA hydratase/isomerase family protein [Emcibacter sp.]